jgi:hypothetical protein
MVGRVPLAAAAAVTVAEILVRSAVCNNRAASGAATRHQPLRRRPLRAPNPEPSSHVGALTRSKRPTPAAVRALTVDGPPHTVDTTPLVRLTRRTAWLAESLMYSEGVPANIAHESEKGLLKRAVVPGPSW